MFKLLFCQAWSSCFHCSQSPADREHKHVAAAAVAKPSFDFELFQHPSPQALFPRSHRPDPGKNEYCLENQQLSVTIKNVSEVEVPFDLKQKFSQPSATPH